MTIRLRLYAIAAMGALSALASSSVQAQYHQRMVHETSNERSISYMIGFAAIDNGFETDSMARAWSVRLTSPIIGRFVIAEFALGGLSTKAPDGVRERFLMPEGQVQLQLPIGPFRPYFGLGGGWVSGPQNTGTVLQGNTAMVTSALGLRTVLAGDKLTLNVEGRARRYGSDADHHMIGGEVTAGFGLRF
jgi:hypothetical protein